LLFLKKDKKDLIKLVKKTRMKKDIPLDTITKLISALYQIECGTIKDGSLYHELGNTEIINGFTLFITNSFIAFV